MTPERLARLVEVFDAASDRPPEDVARFLAEACGDDVELHDEAVALLASVSGSAAAIRGAVAAEVDHLAATESKGLLGTRLGAYRVDALLGEGGMGVVYLGTRADAEYTQQVAIKVLHRGSGNAGDAARFRDERQILAALEHPGIVRLIDGGRTDAGDPYLVMDYVEGIPITRFARSHGLAVRERITLFANVCAAVAYAHRQLVVHRDLKPSNILVDADGAPKLLDFGIAKILAPTSRLLREAHTVGGAAPLTPEYASPEQARGDAVSTATDVYSLGAVLYELLADAPPVTAPEDALALLRLICEVDPPRPSTVCPRDRRRALAGDLDNIVMKALAKTPAARYASVDQLAEDLGRHLDGLPVVAREATLPYRAGKFVRRNRAALAATLVGITALSVLTGVSLQQAHRAERRFGQVRKLANSLVFEIDDKLRDLKGATATRELVVTRALEYLDQLAGEPSADAALERELALAYMRVGEIQGDPFEPNLGRPDAALASYRKARTIIDGLIARDADDPANREALASCLFGAGHIQVAGAPRDAQRELERAVALARTLPRDAAVSPTTIMRGWISLAAAGIATGDLAAAERASTALRDEAERGNVDRPGAEARYWIGIAYEVRARIDAMLGDPDRAVADARIAIAELARLSAEVPSDARYRRDESTTRTSLAGFLDGIGIDNWAWTASISDLDGGTLAAREASELAGRIAASDPDDVRAAADYGGMLSVLAVTLAARDPDTALPVFAQARAVFDALPATARTSHMSEQYEWFVHCAGSVPLARVGRREAALAEARRGLEIVEGPAFSSHEDVSYVVQCRYQVARAHHVLGDDAIAGALLDQVIATLAPRIASKTTEIHNYIGLAASLELLAELRPAQRCALRARAATAWRGWPGRSTAFIERQLAHVQRPDPACP